MLSGRHLLPFIPPYILLLPHDDCSSSRKFHGLPWSVQAAALPMIFGPCLINPEIVERTVNYFIRSLSHKVVLVSDFCCLICFLKCVPDLPVCQKLHWCFRRMFLGE